MKTLQKNVLQLSAGFLLLEVAVFVLYYNTDQKIQQNIDVTNKESLGVIYISHLQSISHSLYDIQGLNLLSDIKGSDHVPLVNMQNSLLIADLRRQLEELSTINDKTAAQTFPLKQKIAGLIAAAEKNLKLKKSGSAQEGMAVLIDEIKALIVYVADDQQLFFDPQRESYFLIILMTQKLPDLIENLTRSRSLGTAMVRQERYGVDDLARLHHQLQSCQEGLKKIELFFNLLFKNAPLPQFNEFRNKFYEFNDINAETIRLISNFIRNPKAQGDGEYFYHKLSSAIDANQAFFIDVAFNLAELLTKRKKQFDHETLVNNVLFFVLIFGLLAGAAYLYIDLRMKRRKELEAETAQHLKALLANQSSLQKLFEDVLGFISEKTKALKGVCYYLNAQNDKLYLGAIYAETAADLVKVMQLGQGIIGQVAKDHKANYQYCKNGSSCIDLGLTTLSHNVVLTLPIIHDGKVVAVVQLLLTEKLSKGKMRLLETLLAIAAHRIHNKSIEQENASIANLVDEYVITSKTNEKGYITSVSQAFIEISGYSREELIGKHHSVIRHPDMPRELFNELWRTIASGNSWRGEVKNQTKNGGYYWVDVIISPDKDFYGNIIGFTAIRHDITDKKRIEELSIRDSMTGLYNRRYFENKFNELIGFVKGTTKKLYFGIIDVDYFKQYNDSYGHQSGDEVLIAVANVLNDSLSAREGFGFRLGGEEFGILFFSQSAREAIGFTDAIRNDVEKLKIEHQKSSVSEYVTLSIGLWSIKTQGDMDTKEQYHQADQLLYQAKKAGRNRVRFG